MTEADLPRRVRAASAQKALRAPCLGHIAAEDFVPVAAVFSTWLALCRARGRRRDAARSLMASALRGNLLGLDMVSNCLVRWHASVSRMEVSASDERVNSAEAVERCRRYGAQVLHSSWIDSGSQTLAAVVSCWHSYTVHYSLQRRLEKLFDEQQHVQDRLARWKDELDFLGAGRGAEREKWQEHREEQEARLQHLEVDHERSRVALAEVTEDHNYLSAGHEEGVMEALSFAAQLADTQQRAQLAEVQASTMLENTDLAEVEAREREEACEEECAAMQAGMQKLQQDAHRHRERRQRDVREARNHFRSQVQRQEDAAQRLAKQREDDEAAWQQRLRVSESKASKLDEEVRRLRDVSKSMPNVVAEIADGNAELALRITDVESELRAFEALERDRRVRMKDLEDSEADTLKCCEAIVRSEEATASVAQLVANLTPSGSATASPTAAPAR